MSGFGPDLSRLRESAAAKGLMFGSSIKREIGTTDPAYAEVLAAACSYLATEAEYHWQFMCPTKGQRDFSRSEWALAFITGRGMKIRGGNLIWHRRVPDWFSTLNQRDAMTAMREQLAAVTSRYAGKAFSWDVVNEALEPNDGHVDGLRKSQLLNTIGPKFIDEAFRVAAANDPNALLVYNEYGFEYETPGSLARRKYLLRLLERMRCSNVPIHALGIQSHLQGAETSFSETRYRAFLKQVSELGYKVILTELDVSDRGLPSDLVTRDRIIADVYERYLNVVLDESAVVAVNTWGLSDRYSWLASVQPRFDGLPVRTLPLDSDLSPKMAWFAIARAFSGAPVRTPLRPSALPKAQASCSSSTTQPRVIPKA